MKQLIALSMKYIRRQKLRTFLTFMCITLSAFILTTICTYGSSSYTTLYNETLYSNGSWEVDISSWIHRAKDREKAEDIIANHAVVDDYIYEARSELSVETDEKIPVSNMIEISDGKNNLLYNTVTFTNYSGNTGLLGEYDKDSKEASIASFTSEKGVFVSRALKDLGYSKGDTVTLTIRPLTAVIDEDSELIKKIRADLKHDYGTEYCKGEEGYQKLNKEQRLNAFGGTLESYLLRVKRLARNTIPYTDIQYGEPVTCTFKIAGFIISNGFISESEDFVTLNTGDEKITLDEFHKKNPDIEYDFNADMRIKLIDNCDYDEAMKMLFTDLGYDYDTQYYDDYEFPHHDNTLLMALKAKSPYAMAEMMVALVPIIIVLLIGWFIARFVIDNTFEMAVQERSTHFAAMRVMGASKTQVAFVVLYEALFYSFTAVPLGMILAVLICRFCFSSLRRAGLKYVEFSAKPAFLITAAVLTLIALFISAYTSAMWASRKLSPAEALNFGKPKSKRKLRKRKSKLNLSSRRWLRRYTKQNIKASKSRFVIATITMGLGVAMFTATSLLGTYIYREFETMSDYITCDFYIDEYICDDNSDPTAETEKYFGDSGIFSEFIVRGYNYNMTLNTFDGSAKIVSNKLLRYSKKGYAIAHPYAICETEYNYYELDRITGMSYEEFRSRDGVLYNNSVYGDYKDFDYETGEAIIKFDEDWTDLGKGFTITDNDGYSYNITGKVSSKLETGTLIIPIEKATQYGINKFDIALNVIDNKHYEEAMDKVEEFRKNCYCYDVDDLYLNATGLKTFLSAIVKIIASFLISIWLVGILSMINSVNTSVLNRSRQLMMLRSVGMTRKQLRKSVTLETIMFSTTAAVTGTILGIGIYAPFIASEMRLRDFYAVPFIAAIALGINILLSILAALPAIRNLSKVESIAQAANG
ncbi:MAG: ABC transporter permease [Ruminococcus sp.]|nr:ABC transporter permease [Ruminococcus sp.]